MFRDIICVDDFLLTSSMGCYLQDSLEAVTKKRCSITNTGDSCSKGNSVCNHNKQAIDNFLNSNIFQQNQI